jgi:hypothetical protein
MIDVLLDAGAELALPVGVIALALLVGRVRDSWLLPLLVLLVLADSLALNLHTWARLPSLVSSGWNWDGKLAALVLTMGALLFLPKAELAQLGMFRGPAAGSMRPLCITIAVVIAFAVARGCMSSIPQSAETLIFQATLPGLHEEFAYRGLWWVLLAATLDRGAIEAGRIPRWTLVITTLLFACAHGVDWSRDSGLMVNNTALAMGTLAGTAYGLVQGYGRCLWLTVLVHNLSNIIVHGLQMAH